MDKLAWRPVAGVRSTSEVYVHIVLANFYLLSVTGPKMLADLKENAEKAVTSKAEVIKWLKRSSDAVKEAHSAETPKDLERKVHIADLMPRSTACIFESLFTPTSTWHS